MPITLPSRALALSAAIATAAVALVTLPAISLAPAPTALADSPSCVSAVADFPNVHGQVYGTGYFYGVDPEVGVYIAGDWDVLPGAAEAEGTIVVGGDANFNNGKYFNLGTVGLGSQVSAGPGTNMLSTGGNVTVGTTTTLDVGNHRGGNIRSNGTITPTSKLQLNGGTATPSAGDALTASASVPAYYQGLSSTLAALPADGTVTSDATSVTFTGTGSSRQVFTVSGSVLGTIAAPKSIDFTGIAANAIVVVNVTGTTAAMSSWGYSMNGAALDFSAAEPDRVFSTWSQSIAWNFPTATNVALGFNAQLPGAVLIPTAGSTLDLQTTINGRLYVNGDVEFGGGSSDGLEIHNYPLRTACVTPATGNFTIDKTISDPDDAALDDRAYTGTYECLSPLGAVVDSGTWSLQAGEDVTISDLPVGSICSAEEDPLTAAPSADDASYTWAAPTYSNDEVTIVDSSDVGITVQNAVLHDVGSISITKALTDADTVVDPDREFTGTYSCVNPADTAPRPVVASGTWSVEAGETQTIDGIADGLDCSITEDTLSAAPSSNDSSYSWSAPSYSPASGVVTTGETVAFTVTNTVSHVVGSLSITKTLTDDDSVVTAGRDFSGTYECRDAGSSVVASGTWTAKAAGAAYVVENIPAPSTCSIAETSLNTAPSATDSSYEWVAPTISPAASVSITADTTTDVIVHNEVRRGLGDLEMIKILDDPFNVVDLDRSYTGTWECTFNGLPLEDGTWETTAGAAPLTLATDLPAGTLCTLAEDAATLLAPPLAGFPQYIWRAPVVSPATVSIVDGVVHRFTVTNTVYDPIGEVSSLAHSGTDSLLPILIGGGVLGAGILFIIIARRRRVA